MVSVTGRELAKEIQSSAKGFKAEWMDRREYEAMFLNINGEKLQDMSQFDKYCEEMSGEVIISNVKDLKN